MVIRRVAADEHFMNFQILVNNASVLQGNLVVSVLIAVVVAVVVLLGMILILRRLARRFKENDVMKYEFITIVAHKFRTPLTHMKWIIETFAGSETDPYKLQNIKELEKANQKLITLTGTLIEITDSSDATQALYALKPTNLCEFVRTVTTKLRDDFHEKNLFFSLKCESDEIYVSIDPVRLEFVLQTLLENSINYSVSGRNVDVTIFTEKHKAVCSVTDNGIGISADDVSRIFSKFYRAKEAQRMDTEGFGIGLYLAQSIMNRLHGTLAVYSEGLNKGSTFSMVLPLIKKPKEA
jgi:signal transduction histidine kinase